MKKKKREINQAPLCSPFNQSRAMGSSSSSSSSSLLLFLSLSLSFCISTCIDNSLIKDIHLELEHPLVEVSPSPILGYPSRDGTAKEILSCSRVRVVGLSRLKIRSYFNSFRVTVTPSGVIPERLHSKIAICFLRNASLAPCQCAKDDWGTLQKGKWSAVMSPYEDKYLDLKFSDGLSGTLAVSVEEVSSMAFIVLVLGFGLLLLAPIFSNWIPFYYCSSMAIGVLLVVLIILFQVSVFLLAGIVLAGAALGYWIVRKFIISEDGSVDGGIAQFVKWAMRAMAVSFIFQSSLDTPLAALALACCCGIDFLISLRWRHQRSMQLYQVNRSPWLQRARHGSASQNRTEFLSSSTKISPGRKLWNSPKRSYASADSPTKGLVLSSPSNGAMVQKDYYSTFHRTPMRKRFSKKEWDEFTQESTRQALAEWASSPEFTDWIVDNADRVRITQSNSDDSMGCGSDSSDETVVDNGSGLSFFKW
ncbi:hypothetical protein Sjap_002500 [Stephania japonica]|uniref:Uncharacterized protein n=1 Tax=Stephania japonica TaxID=461633 RepID=A0AAP0PU81_9MAGN